MGAGYLQFTNNSPEDIRITHISSPQLESVEMHETILKDDIARMAKLAEVVVPAGQSLSFEPGAKHLMLRYPETIPQQVTLHFFAGDEPLLSVATVVGGD
jgi:copper(I)-binding protein